MLLIQRLIFFSLSLGCLYLAGSLWGLSPINFMSLLISGPALLASFGLMLSWNRPYHTFKGIFRPPVQASREELERSRLKLDSLWQHLWHTVLLLLLIGGVSVCMHSEDMNAVGHSLAVLLDGVLFLLLTGGIFYLPAKIRLSSRLRSLPAID